MEDFFSYKPIVVGVVLDLRDFTKIECVKNALIGLAQTFTAATEDKLYIYRPKVTHLRRWVSESVADIAGYRVEEPINPRNALTQTASVLSVIDPDYSNKNILYFTDRDTIHRTSQVKQALSIEKRMHSGCRISLLNMGHHSESLANTASINPKAMYLWIGNEMTVKFLEDLIYAKDIIHQPKFSIQTTAIEMVPFEGEQDPTANI